MSRSKPLLLAALALCGAWLLIAANLSWVRVSITGGLQLDVTGGQLSPLLPAVGAVILAATAALLLLRGWGRPLAAALAALAAGWLSINVLTNLTGPWSSASQIAHIALTIGGVDVSADVSAVEWTPLAAVSLAVALIAVMLGVLVMLTARHWAVAGRRFERGASDDSPSGTWDALTSGDDPTEVHER